MARLGVSFSVTKNAERLAPRPSYLARLVRDGSTVRRDFVDKVKRGERRAYIAIVEPGQAVELRLTYWSQDAQDMLTRVFHLINNGGPELVAVDADAAFDFVASAGALPAPEAGSAPAKVFASVARILPAEIGLWDADEAEARQAAKPAQSAPKLIEHEPAALPAPVDPAAPIGVGEAVEHATNPAKFGRGRVVAVAGGALTVEWEKGGWQGRPHKGRMVASFVRRATA